MKTRCLAVALASIVMSGCVSIVRPCEGNFPTFSRDGLLRKVTLAEAKRNWLAAMELETLPLEAQAGVIRSVDEDFEAFAAKTLPADVIWSYRYEKCAGCGWYTEGIVALRGSCIAAELTMKDDM